MNLPTMSGSTGWTGDNSLDHLLKSCRNGFTLLEILVAIFIFAIVATTIFGSFNAVVGNVAEIEASAAKYDMGKTCLNRIVSDINALYISLPPEYTPPKFNENPDLYQLLGEKDTIGESRFSKLRFVADAHLPMEGDRRTGIARIVYYVQQTKEGTHVLRRSDVLYPFGEFEENDLDPILCENLSGLDFIFYDNEGKEYEDWDSDSVDTGYATPDAVKITLKIGDPPDELILQTLVTIPVRRERRPT
jgi:general secretion pathway protein J